ncbi:MAG: phosphotransferase [Nocardioides sp.]
MTDADVLAAIREHWSTDVDGVEHLPVGFGAHHWSATMRGRPVYFLTLDGLSGKHDAASLEAAYAVASGLMFPLDFVVAPVPSHGGSLTVPFAGAALSVTPWIVGENPPQLDLDVVADMLRRLHAVTPPPGLREWTTVTAPSLPMELTALVRTPWEAGPYGERARSAVRGRLDAIEEWSATYHALADLARRRPWVITHGEPGEHNLMVTVGKTRLVDWETIRLAPAERDWRTLVEHGLPTDGLDGPWDGAMLELFDLEWRLDEISQYAAWFSTPHTGTASDRVAMGGLLHELIRAPLRPGR